VSAFAAGVALDAFGVSVTFAVADALGSVGVVVSSVIVRSYRWEQKYL
jgi:Co/Zn/Cd efflux system component